MNIYFNILSCENLFWWLVTCQSLSQSQIFNLQTNHKWEIFQEAFESLAFNFVYNNQNYEDVHEREFSVAIPQNLSSLLSRQF